MHALRFALLPALLLAVLTAAGTAAAQTAKPTPLMQMPRQAATPTPVPFVSSRPMDTVIANVNGAPFRLSDLRPYAETGKVASLEQIPPTRLADAPTTDLLSAASFITVRKAAEQALAANQKPEVTSQAQKMYQTELMQELAQKIYRTEVIDKISSPSLDAQKEYYEQNKARFILPAYFKMRHLILYTYQPYIVKAGDTLEEIAKTVNGDSASAAQIRADIEQRPLRREPDKEFKALVEGEKLLVPMGNAEADKVKLRLESLLKQNVKFEDLATTYSDAETKGQELGPLPTGTRPLVPELMKYGFETPVGSVSPVFRTKHGWNAIQVTDRNTTRTPSFEDKKADIVTTLRQKQQEELTQKLIGMLMDQPDSALNSQALAAAAAGNQPSSDTVIYSAGTHKVYYNEIKRDFEQEGMSADPAKQRDSLKKARAIVQANLLHYLDRTQNDLTDAEKQRHEALKTLVFGNAYLNEELRSRLRAAISEVDIEKFYNENKTTMFSTPAQVKYESMSLLIDPALPGQGAEREAAIKKLTAELNEYLAKVKTLEDFQRMAQQVNLPLQSKQMTPRARWSMWNSIRLTPRCRPGFPN